MNAPAVGSFPTPEANRIDQGDTIAFGTINPPTLAQPKVDDRGPRIPAQRVYGGTLARADEESAQMLLNVADVLGQQDVPEPVLDDIRRSLARLSGDADAVREILRFQRVIDAYRAGDLAAADTLVRARKALDTYEGVKPAAPDVSCPYWCNDCSTKGGYRFHSGKVGEFTDHKNPQFPCTVQVWVQRTDRMDGGVDAPGLLRSDKACVYAVGHGDSELTPLGALRYGELYAKAARIALHDQAEQAARGGAR